MTRPTEHRVLAVEAAWLRLSDEAQRSLMSDFPDLYWSLAHLAARRQAERSVSAQLNRRAQ